MQKITLLDELPVILTKDPDWEADLAKPGSIIVLPEDAILVITKDKELKNEN